jgi:hypothetical protein
MTHGNSSGTLLENKGELAIMLYSFYGTFKCIKNKVLLDSFWDLPEILGIQTWVEFDLVT